MDKKAIEKKWQPNIEIKTIVFPEVSIRRDPDVEVSPRIDMSINRTYNYNKEISILQVNLHLVIKEKDSEKLLIDILGVAIFEITETKKVLVEYEDKKLTIDHFAEYNAPAIVYPFLREYVSYVSRKAGIDTIVLPIMNFHAIGNLNKIKKNTDDS